MTFKNQNNDDLPKYGAIQGRLDENNVLSRHVKLLLFDSMALRDSFLLEHTDLQFQPLVPAVIDKSTDNDIYFQFEGKCLMGHASRFECSCESSVIASMEIHHVERLTA